MSPPPSHPARSPTAEDRADKVHRASEGAGGDDVQRAMGTHHLKYFSIKNVTKYEIFFYKMQK